MHKGQARARMKRKGWSGWPLVWPGRNNKLKMWPGSKRLLREAVHMRKETHYYSNKSRRTRGQGLPPGSSGPNHRKYIFF